MEYRNLGNTGLNVSALSFGSYLTFGHSVDVCLAEKLMNIAYDAGINLFDNAEVYALGHSEKIMGEVLKKAQWPRDTYVIMTKVFWGGGMPTQIGLHRKHIYEACHSSLMRLKIDYIDLFLCHRPDPNTSIIETVRAMNSLIQQGKILYWGTSEWKASQIIEAILIAQMNNLIPPSLEQFEYNMFWSDHGEKELADLFLLYNLGATTTMPLLGGILTGKYNEKIPHNSRVSRHKNTKFRDVIFSDEWRDTIQKVDKLVSIAQDIGITLAQLAIAWCLKNKYISSVIVGVTNEGQLLENLKSIQYLDAIDKNTISSINSILGKKVLIPNNKERYNYAKIKTTV